MNEHLIACRSIKGLGTNAKAVLRILCDRANEEGKCWPSYETIAEDACMSKRSVQRAVEELDGVWLTRSRSNYYNVYTLTLKSGQADHSKEIESGHTVTPRVANWTPRVDTQSTKSGHTVTLSNNKQQPKQHNKQQYSGAIQFPRVPVAAKATEATRSFAVAETIHPQDILELCAEHDTDPRTITENCYEEMRDGTYVYF